MAIAFPPDLTMQIIRLAILGQDHRVVAVELIDAYFVQEVADFLEELVAAKGSGETINEDWYRESFLDPTISTSEQLLWRAGLNKKTVENARGSSRREVIIEEALSHHDKFARAVDSMIDGELDLSLTISTSEGSVELDLAETIVVVNALAVRRAALRGGVWSTMGKQVESPLMETLCRMYNVPNERYGRRPARGRQGTRESDFYLIPEGGNEALCEVKLMGKGNPEGVDSVFARGSQVVVASTLSDANKRQLDGARRNWTELQSIDGFRRFEQTLQALVVPYETIPHNVDLNQTVEEALEAVFGN